MLSARKRFTIALIATISGSIACHGSDCISGVGAPGVLLSVRDSSTNESLDSLSIVTVVRLTNTLSPSQPDSVQGRLVSTQSARGPLSITDDHAAQYSITVEVPGYVPWRRLITVERGCGSVRTVSVTARLQLRD